MNPRPLRSRIAHRALLVAALALMAAAVTVSCAVLGRSRKVQTIVTEAVSRRDIDQTVQATGTVEPVETVEIKSKASGQVLRMSVQVGSVVRAGDLLAQVDTVNVQNQYDQALASLRAAQANVEVTVAQKQRADELFSRAVITTDQHETATLAFANAQSDLVRARTNLEIARQALEDATVRAPSGGTVLSQPVVKGQVISSATQSVSGGTTILTMADLSRIQMRALVGETDIGSVRPGLPATVAVDAFPNRTFRGQVLKVEPQAVVQQSVTMFPVLVTIQNEGGVLLPGMNGEVTVYVNQRRDVLAVPLDAVRTVRELPAVATALGVDADSAQAQVQRQMEAWSAERARADSAADSSRGRAGWSGAAAGRLAAGASMGEAAGAARTRRDRRAGVGSQPGAEGAWRRGQGSGSTRSGGAGSGGGGLPGGGPPATMTGSNAGATADNGRSARQAQVVFVKTSGGLEARLVRLGISDYDYAQVLGGLKEGEEVALLSVAEAQAKRESDQTRLRQRMGSGVPGVGGSAGAGRGPSGGR